MKKKLITAAIPAVLLVLGLVLGGCPQATGGSGDDPVTPVTPPTVSSVEVSPSAVSVKKESTRQFSATVVGTNNPAQTVNWTVEGKNNAGTTISNTGLLSVATGETAASLSVKAVSTVDNGKSGSAQVTVTTGDPAGTYTVTFATYGGTAVAAETGLNSGAKLYVNGYTSTRSGYTFAGWYSAASGGAKYTGSITITGDLTLHAQWTAASPDSGTSYTVTFEAYNGSPAPAQEIIGNGNLVTEPDPMTKPGYEFMGWFTEATFENRWNFSTGTVSANMTLYAKWVPSLKSIIAIASYIDAEAAAGKGGSASNPISIPAEINLGGSGWQSLLSTINSKGKFVELDLTRCTMDGTAFDPVPSVSTGKNKIVKLILPDAAERIPAGTDADPTFKHFSALTSLAGANIEGIGAFAFYARDSLTSVSFPKATSIGDYAFSGCTSLTSVSIPAATSIGTSAFHGCTSLTSICFSKSATLGDDLFVRCTSLSSFDLTGDGTLSVIENGKALVRNNELIAYPSASGTITINSITITIIGRNAFSNCASLTSVSFPYVATIGDQAFYNCVNLTSVDFPAATSIGRGSFHNCLRLASPSFPNVRTIGEYAFNGCTGLTALGISRVTNIGSYAFAYTGTNSLTITMGAATPTVGVSLFTGVNSTKNVTVQVPGGATGYGANWPDAFKGKGSGSGGMLNSNINLTVAAL